MTDEQIERIIKIIADEAWGIAFEGKSPPGVCLAIEALSDDPETCAKLVNQIKEGLAGWGNVG